MVALRTMALKHHTAPFFPRTGLVENDDDLFRFASCEATWSSFWLRRYSRRHRMSATVRSKTLSLELALVSVHGSARYWLLLALEKWQEYFRYGKPGKYLKGESLNPRSNPSVNTSVISTEQAEFNMFDHESGM